MGSAGSSFASSLSETLFKYNTVKTVQIKSKSVGVIFRLLQVGIIVYVAIVSIYLNKTYQAYDTALSSVATKIKGIGATCNDPNQTDLFSCAQTEIQTWDTADFTVPVLENNAFFLITNRYDAPLQVQGSCNEDPQSKIIACSNGCNNYLLNQTRNGVINGECNTTNNNCLVTAWCPVELQSEEDLASNLTMFYYKRLSQTPTFTIYVKNRILFPVFNYEFTNNPGGAFACVFDPTNPSTSNCIIFTVNYMAQQAGMSASDIQAMIAQGALLACQISWNCDLDQSTTSCTPTYKFIRLDPPTDPGFNFRTVSYAQEMANDSSSTVYRSVSKVFGLRMVFIVDGIAGKFSVVALFVAIGSGLGLLGVATLLGDFLVLYILPGKAYYTGKKFEIINEESRYDDLESSNVTASNERMPLIATRETTA